MKSYFITDPKYYQDTDSFERYLRQVYTYKKPSFAAFRDKKNKNFELFAEKFVKISKYFQIEKVLINKEIEIAKNLKADGVHLTSLQFDKIKYAKDLGLFVIISTHSKEEAKIAKELGADAITYSPIFPTPGKGTPKGTEDLKALLKTIKIKCFALGGIVSDKEVELCKECGCYGFASIRYFVK